MGSLVHGDPAAEMPAVLLLLGGSLILQDAAGADVPVLLYLIWCARSGRPVDAAEVVRAEACITSWRGEVIEPLRAVRRAMRSNLLPGQPTEACREGLKAVELEAERLALAALAASAPEPAGAAGSGNAVLTLYAAHLGAPWPAEAAGALRAALAAS